MQFEFKTAQSISDFAAGYNVSADWVKLLYNKEFLIEWYTEKDGVKTTPQTITDNSKYGSVITTEGQTRFTPTALLRQELTTALKPDENVVVLILHAGLAPEVEPDTFAGENLSVEVLNEAFKKRDLQMKYLEHKAFNTTGAIGQAGLRGTKGDAGLDGDKGNTGDQGAKGATGGTGAKGAKGAKGS